ncbi:MAG: Fic family protein [Candidatus Hydrogenedentes bacterium]|nr:Fic family protein [Candidatus Hydrogenedentota bacterium]
MKFEDFHAGNYKQQYQYKSFLPTPINQEWHWEDPRINVLLAEANRTLGELNAMTTIAPNVDLFINMHVAKEATTSSRIEGTKTEMEEVFLDPSDLPPKRRDDQIEVRNYIDALNPAIQDLERLPLSLRLLRNTHAILMRGARGESKAPGEFRKSQNWIGGTNLSDAAFIPPHHDDIGAMLDDLEAFWHNETIQVPHLIRIALSHYQFETIHPFLDGNGRIGRLLITLYLVNHGLLAKPSLYLSAQLEKHRTEYYDALSRARASNDIGQWCRFFLQAVIDTATNGKETLERLFTMKQEHDQLVLGLGRRAENGAKLLAYLYDNPVMSVSTAMNLTGLSKNSARDLVREFEALGLLLEATGHKRNRIYVFPVYLSAFKVGED